MSSEILKHKAATPAKPATLKRQYRKYPTVPRDTSDCGSPNLSAHLPGMPQRAPDSEQYPGPSGERRPQSQPESLNGEAMQGSHNATEPWSNHELLTNALNAVLNSASDVSNGGGAWHADESTAHQDAMKQEPMDETEMAKRPSEVEQPHWARGTHSHDACNGAGHAYPDRSNIQRGPQDVTVPPDLRTGPEPLPGQELLNQALSAFLNGHGHSTSSTDHIFNGSSRADDAKVLRKEAVGNAGSNRTAQNLNGSTTAASPEDDLRNMSMEELKAEVLRSEIRRNISEERRNVAMTKFFDRLAERF